ncbi:hypothetical protein K493DRAFT_405076 [Basidiobolus meristosporus CBS 931.73]|uniref:Uncharacterized protein n=1 Tax=Basidiobolus meristosporus CBS 931.73 TaxID=1314790 RepID=A0A1Y1YYT6_9FUNG|nr:hypothetical protein K493DRAFT_405076 [Basidiobolus meristosporus CBS 931.73]|eukprot:ORY03106.1 hypothetical protein K493DRAFT_405076 [Basidiobolus meristosporus CBS 931.73]
MTASDSSILPKNIPSARRSPPKVKNVSSSSHTDEKYPFYDDDDGFQGSALQIGDDSFYDQVELTVVENYTPYSWDKENVVNEEDDAQLFEFSGMHAEDTKQHSKKYNSERSTRERSTEGDHDTGKQQRSMPSHRQESKPSEALDDKELNGVAICHTDMKANPDILNNLHRRAQTTRPEDILSRSRLVNPLMSQYNGANPSQLNSSTERPPREDQVHFDHSTIEPHDMCESRDIHINEQRNESSNRHQSKVEDNEYERGYRGATAQEGYRHTINLPVDEYTKRHSAETAGSMKHQKRARSPKTERRSGAEEHPRKSPKIADSSHHRNPEQKSPHTRRSEPALHKAEREYRHGQSYSRHSNAHARDALQEPVDNSAKYRHEQTTTRNHAKAYLRRPHPAPYDPEYYEGTPLVIEKAIYDDLDDFSPLSKSNTSSKPRVVPSRNPETEAAPTKTRSPDVTPHKLSKKQDPAKIYSLDRLLNLMSEK